MTASRQRGVALLTVLLLVALVSGLALAALDDVRFGVRSESNAQTVARARWHALGAEQLAGALIRRARAAPAPTASMPDTPLVFPVEGGAVAVRLRDASTCFNLNSVVEGAPEQWQRSQRGVERFLALLEAVGIPQGTAAGLADSLVDWIDSDQVRSPAGAEDRDYPGHLTAGALLAEPSELRAIAGYDAAIHSRLLPVVCALPDARPVPVNVNALEARHGAILAMLTLGGVDAGTGARLLESRPPDGWRDVDAFWSLPAFSALDPQARGDVAVRGTLFALGVEVELDEVLVEMSASLQDDAGATTLLARRWSAPE